MNDDSLEWWAVPDNDGPAAETVGSCTTMNLEEKKARAQREFTFWADQYQQTRSKPDLLAVGQCFGLLCAYYDGDVPVDISKAMEEISATLAAGYSFPQGHED